MSASDEDYMSQDILKNTKETESHLPRKHRRDLYLFKKSQSENYKTSKKGRIQIEEEKRRELMDTKISEENIGFKMLEKMGYKPGSALGTREKGITEPIKAEIKKDRGGVGKEKAEKLKVLKEIEKNKKIWESKNADFSERMKNEHLDKEMRKDLKKLQNICRDIDLRQGIKEPIQPYFWPAVSTETDEQLTKLEILVQNNPGFDIEYMSEDRVKKYTESISNYLRVKYLYCYWCASFYTGTIYFFIDSDDMKSNCPGDTKEEHD